MNKVDIVNEVFPTINAARPPILRFDPFPKDSDEFVPELKKLFGRLNYSLFFSSKASVRTLHFSVKPIFFKTDKDRSGQYFDIAAELTTVPGTYVAKLKIACKWYYSRSRTEPAGWTQSFLVTYYLTKNGVRKETHQAEMDDKASLLRGVLSAIVTRVEDDPDLLRSYAEYPKPNTRPFYSIMNLEISQRDLNHAWRSVQLMTKQMPARIPEALWGSFEGFGHEVFPGISVRFECSLVGKLERVEIVTADSEIEKTLRSRPSVPVTLVHPLTLTAVDLIRTLRRSLHLLVHPDNKGAGHLKPFITPTSTKEKE